MSRKYFGTDGIRGRVGEGAITPQFFLKFGWVKFVKLCIRFCSDCLKQNFPKNKFKEIFVLLVFLFVQAIVKNPMSIGPYQSFFLMDLFSYINKNKFSIKKENLNLFL